MSFPERSSRPDRQTGRDQRSGKGHGWARAVRELDALATQARYLAFDLKETHEPGSGPSCVFIHGLYASAGVFRPLRGALKQSLDCSSHSFSYRPGPGLVELGVRLEKLISRIQADREIVLIGHSLGGLLACDYVSRPDHDDRVCATISLAAPFRGSVRHFLVPGAAGRDVAPGAADLRRLSLGTGRPTSLPHLSLLAAEDEMIEAGAYPSFGEQRLIPRVGHNGILFHPEVRESVVRWVRANTQSRT